MIRPAIIGPVIATGLALSAPAFAQPPTPTPDRIFVHLEGPDDAVLEKRDAGGEWIAVCEAPCDKWLPAFATYRVDGDDVRSSRPFALAGSPGGRVDLVVDVSTRTAFAGGIVLGVVGFAAIPVGLVIILAGEFANSPCGFDSESPCGEQPSGGGLIAAGAITAIVGAIVGTLGVVEAVSNVRSNVAQSPRSANDAPQSARMPPWRDTPAAARAATPPSTAVPLYTFTF